MSNMKSEFRFKNTINNRPQNGSKNSPHLEMQLRFAIAITTIAVAENSLNLNGRKKVNFERNNQKRPGEADNTAELVCG